MKMGTSLAKSTDRPRTETCHQLAGSMPRSGRIHHHDLAVLDSRGGYLFDIMDGRASPGVYGHARDADSTCRGDQIGLTGPGRRLACGLAGVHRGADDPGIGADRQRITAVLVT